MMKSTPPTIPFMRPDRRGIFAALACLVLLVGAHAYTADGLQPASATAPRPLKVLFLGDGDGTHQSAGLFTALAPVLARHGIQLTHVSTPAEALTSQVLGDYDGLLLYGDHTAITPAQERALVGFVEGGKGLVAINAAIEMFPSSSAYGDLIGARGERKGSAEFTAEPLQASGAILKGLQPFSTTDDTYTFTKQSAAGRSVLMERVEGSVRTPQTWIRTQGKGRVFYTAYGSEKTWQVPGFRQLVEQGLLYAVPDEARKCRDELKMPELKYEDGHNVPNYENRDPAPKFQLPFTPQESMKFVQVPAGFSLELFASEPDIVKPISFTFDERGRLWVIEAIDYPNDVRNGEPGDDRIKIVEDTNGDGKADKFTIFADRSEPRDEPDVRQRRRDRVGGAAHAVSERHGRRRQGGRPADPQHRMGDSRYARGPLEPSVRPRQLHLGLRRLLRVRRRDEREEAPVHAGHVPVQAGRQRLRVRDDVDEQYVGTGLLPRTSTCSVRRRTTIPAFSSRFRTGSSRASRACRRRAAADRAIRAPRSSTPRTTRLRTSARWTCSGATRRAAGHYFYTARSFPKEYWNRIAFITEPTAHIVGQGIIESNGAGFVTRDGWNLLSGSEEWVAPVHAQVGPDGAVWVSDWYNFIAQHNPTPMGYVNGRGNAYEQPLRDHSTRPHLPRRL